MPFHKFVKKWGADVVKVAEGMGYDSRIGKSFLNAGIGYGGSCFPKDVSAFIKIAEKVGYEFDLLKSTEFINLNQRKIILKKLEDALWTFKNKTVGILGLAFKPDTDDLRNAPALDYVKALLEGGAHVKAYDPAAMEKMKNYYPQIEYCKNPYQTAEDADALLVVTEWKEIRQMDLKKIRNKMKTKIIIDGRNIFDPMVMQKLGFTYFCVGRFPTHHMVKSPSR